MVNIFLDAPQTHARARARARERSISEEQTREERVNDLVRH